jgi:NAD(P)-dependent dehydrogenase (short-subunit alcohol dehydrogenase family)
MTTSYPSGRVILITGISSGLGREISEILASAGHVVYGTTRRETTTNAPVHILRMDLTDISSIKKAVADVIKNEGRIDILINNAGMHTGGPIETSALENIKLQFETNFFGMVHLTREVLPFMREQGGGTVINISSIGGLMGLPFQAFYSAAKFAMEGFSEALRMEVRQFNIKVVLINPGDFHTNNTLNRRNYLAPTGTGDPYREQFASALEVMEKDEFNGGQPSTLAVKIARIVRRGNPRQRYIIASFDQKLAVLLKYILPGKLFRLILESHYRIR